jgi:glycosyltransferase involved in cell wall biosynthesis
MTIAGSGVDEAALRALARTLGVTERVTFRGFVDDPYPLMRAADLYVLSSRYEGFPNVALEALACGTPVVAAACPGVAGLVVPGVNGWLAPPDDVRRGLADALALCRAHAERSSPARRSATRCARFDARRITLH